jgi:uncharacterized membrane protein
MTVAPEASPRRRVAVLDGIRGIAIVLVVLSLNVFGDGLRDALDPRAKLRVDK